MAWAGNVTEPEGLSGLTAREGNREQRRKKRGGCDEVASPVNSWSQGHKVSDALCVHKR